MRDASEPGALPTPGGPRVRLLDADSAPLLVRDHFAGGDPGPIVASLAQVPELLEVALPFVGAALGPGSLGERGKEIAVLRTSALLECRYCVQTHTAVALDAGLTAGEVRALRGEQGLDVAFPDPRERLMIEWIDAVALGRGTPPGELQRRAARALEDHALVELTLAVGATLMLNRYCTALDLPTSPGTLARLAAEGF